MGKIPRMGQKRDYVVEEWRQIIIDAIEPLIDSGEKTAKQIGLEAGLGATFVRDFIERGQVPGVNNLIKLVNYLGLDIEYVFSKEHKPSEEIAAVMQAVSMARTMSDLGTLPEETQRLIIEGLRQQIEIAKNARGGHLPMQTQPATHAKKRA